MIAPMKVKVTMDFRRVFPFLILLVLFLAACGGAGRRSENIYIADEADSGQTVTMGAGDQLQVILRENQSTGYVWSVVTNDDAVLRPIGEPDYEVDSDAEGAGGQVTFTFEAVGSGTSALSMVNAMTQETAVEPGAIFELTVNVVE
jgi:predicted secreted protein